MLNEKIRAALNKQLNAELYSSYLYLSMSAYFQSINLPGFANWMRVQAQEELVAVEGGRFSHGESIVFPSHYRCRALKRRKQT